MKRYLTGIVVALFCSVVMVVNAHDCRNNPTKSACEARYGL